MEPQHWLATHLTNKEMMMMPWYIVQGEGRERRKIEDRITCDYMYRDGMMPYREGGGGGGWGVGWGGVVSRLVTSLMPVSQSPHNARGHPLQARRTRRTSPCPRCRARPGPGASPGPCADAWAEEVGASPSP